MLVYQRVPVLRSNINHLPATCDKVMRAPPPARTEPREYVEAGWWQRHLFFADFLSRKNHQCGGDIFEVSKKTWLEDDTTS